MANQDRTAHMKVELHLYPADTMGSVDEMAGYGAGPIPQIWSISPHVLFKKGPSKGLY